MKTIYLILITLLSFQSSCTKADNINVKQNELLGKWQLIEVFDIYSGNSENPWTPIENGLLYTFLKNGVMESSEFNCNGTYIFNSENEYQLQINFNCNEIQYSGVFKVTFQENTLILEEKDTTCDEGCAEKFRRIQDE
ncbi:MAG: hypothetical protein COZ75_13595 [Flavobacteriaceae bacterium CG_4_8_14_3_um_filter_34_10]|nr:hypothetical protein [Flavobacteriia bacterium]PIV50217.1 MAG: hypothetical protein COS19_04695 [Flavobacteriaceae bacterium CG02_land_8_20_14_3_00_34_13]PIX08133.1 MAG: hypothetical protein COZ75_13595 [Flavobacteriaceae bacterium CG_4_8_14_3_um_filter_34_10]PIZ08377.1 MAG: hypothetical protein COY56_04200 [Flavobacteriaceae bacterium CG_4_10_14_0_8_um_filter_34_31]PJC08268.1 MAG: hypothetical protein CO068_01845 [Flavobacteriaceae bacterium CG_4_9_14_0_8_um_filter_34_30]